MTAAAGAAPLGISPGSVGDLDLSSHTWTAFAGALGIQDVRTFVQLEAGDATEVNDQNAQIAYANSASGKYDVLVQLERCEDDSSCVGDTPTPSAYAAEVQHVVTSLPNVHEWSAWNEPNPGGDAAIAPATAAAYYAAAKQVLVNTPGHQDDTLVAGEFALDDPADAATYERYVDAYVSALYGDEGSNAAAMPTAWSIHPYGDITDTLDPYSDGTCASAVSGLSSTLSAQFVTWLDGDPDLAGQSPSVWLTESGVLLTTSRLTDGFPTPTGLDNNAQLQENEACAFKALPSASAQIARDYYYEWLGPGTPALWDTGLLDANGNPRPVACVLLGVNPSTYCGGSVSAGAPKSTTALEPVASAAPAISTADPLVGTPLTATAGGWSGYPASSSPTYTWSECGTSGTCLPIAGATSSSYTPTVADIGDRLEVTVTAVDPWGSTTSESTQTATVQAPVTLPAVVGHHGRTRMSAMQWAYYEAENVARLLDAL